MGKLKQLGEGAAKDQQRLKVCMQPRAHAHLPRARGGPAGTPAPPLPPVPCPRPAPPTPRMRAIHAQACARMRQVNKEAAQRFIAAGLGGGGGGDGGEREGKKEKREKPDLEDSGKKKKKKKST